MKDNEWPTYGTEKTYKKRATNGGNEADVEMYIRFIANLVIGIVSKKLALADRCLDERQDH